MRSLFFLPLLFWSVTSPAAFEWSPQGARAMSLGGMAVVLPLDPFAACANPALLASFPAFSIGALHMPGLFSLPGLAATSAVITMPVGGSGGLFRVSRFGSESYSELRLGAGWGWELAGELDGGARIDVDHLVIDGYGSLSFLSLTVGVVVRPVPALTVGLVIDNLFAATPPGSLERPPLTVESGLTVQALEEVRLLVRMTKDPLFPLECAMAVEAVLGSVLALRAGATFQPSTWSGGIGCRLAAWDLDYALAAHPALGFTQMISLVCRPGEL